MVNLDNDTLRKARKAILEGAEWLAIYSHEMWDEDEEVSEEAARCCNHLRDIVSQISPPDSWKGNVVPFVPREVRMKALPPDRGRV